MSYINETFGIDVPRHCLDIMDIAADISKREDGGWLYGGLVELAISKAPYWYVVLVEAWDYASIHEKFNDWEHTPIMTQARYLLAYARWCADKAFEELPETIALGYDDDMPDPRKVL